MTQSRVTIEHVAKAAGVSRQTVSRVINRKSNVAAPARKRVEAAIADLGYVPNAAARRMGGARSYLLLAVIDNAAGAGGSDGRAGRLPLDAMLMAGLDACGEAGYHILFEQVGADPSASLARLNHTLTALSPDGVILTPPLDERSDLRGAIETRNIALECLGERVEFGRTIQGIDEGALGEAAANHLVDLGHRQVGFVMGCMQPSRSEKRVAGYRRVMAAKGNRAHLHFTCAKPLDFTAARELARSWLVPTIRPTAIIAETEEVALAILESARELALSVPNDVSLICLEDRASLSRADPPITALSQPYAALFHESCSKLIERAESQQGAAEGVAELGAILGVELIERESVTKAPRAV